MSETPIGGLPEPRIRPKGTKPTQIEIPECFTSDPVGYLVMHFEGSHGVWEVFEHLDEAQKCAKQQEEEHEFWCKRKKSWEIYPLYPGPSFINDSGP